MKGKRKISSYDEILTTLKELRSKYPADSMGKHLSTALSDYGDLWTVSDKEIVFALNKYKTERDLDFFPESPDAIDKIIQDGMDLDKILRKEDGEEEDYD
jgi:hypothetical protein